MTTASYKVQKRRRRFPRRLIAVGGAIVAILIIATLIIRFEYNRNLQPVSSSHQVHYVTVAPGASVNNIAASLRKVGVIRSSAAFEWYVSAHEYRDMLQAGTYSFMPSQSTPEIVAALVNGEVATNLVTIIPGQSIDQVREAFIKSGFKPQDVDAALSPGQYRSTFPALADSPPSASLEGFLYPDSYQKTANTNPKQIVQEALEEMQDHLTVGIRDAYAKEGLTTYQGVTLASIIEREVSASTDRAEVAQVLLKRLQIGMPLEADATAMYGAVQDKIALPSNSAQAAAAAIKHNSPYNTYIHKGLPPGPISSVSAQSLQAVANPAHTDWLYFVTGDNGNTYFSNTLEQQVANTNKYCHLMCAPAQ